MGIFGNRTKQAQIKLAQEMAHSANEANKEVSALLTSYEESSNEFAHLPNELIDLAKQIMEKLTEPEMKELTDLTQRICHLHQDYLDKYNTVVDIALSQSSRTTQAINRYQQISQ